MEKSGLVSTNKCGCVEVEFIKLEMKGRSKLIQYHTVCNASYLLMIIFLLAFSTVTLYVSIPQIRT